MTDTAYELARLDEDHRPGITHRWSDDWFIWSLGQLPSGMTDDDIRRHAQVAWDTCDGDVLRAMRAEASRRGIQVV
jgi:dissimilatory sulfite reductase (desulfoviridin) alpha/beta subunit